MKKLLLILFSLMLPFSSYGEGLCYASFNKTSNNISVILDDEMPDLEYDELLTVCEEGDILSMSGFGGLYSDYFAKRTSQLHMSHIMASYCDLSETQVIDNSILVCKIVDRDLK